MSIDPFSIFVVGTHYDVERYTPNKGWHFVSLKFVDLDAFGNKRAGFVEWATAVACSRIFFDVNHLTVKVGGKRMTFTGA